MATCILPQSASDARPAGRAGSVGRRPDALLLPYLRAQDETTAERHLERLLREHAEPIIAGILRRRWHAHPLRYASRRESPDEDAANEARGAILTDLLIRLRRCKADPDSPDDAIGDFRAYVAVTAYRACDEGLRRKYPRRESLKNRVRYLLARHPDIARRGNGGSARHNRPDIGSLPLTEQMAALYEHAGRPLGLEELVNAVATLQGIHDAPPRQLEAEEMETGARLGDAVAVSIPEEVVRRDTLRRLWGEILELPPRQRGALLLNLRDDRGRGVLALLPLSGIATLRQIAAALEMPAEEFAALWNDLPLDDAAIAGRLGCTRQQVISLRKVARERLARWAKAE